MSRARSLSETPSHALSLFLHSDGAGHKGDWVEEHWLAMYNLLRDDTHTAERARLAMPELIVANKADPSIQLGPFQCDDFGGFLYSRSVLSVKSFLPIAKAAAKRAKLHSPVSINLLSRRGCHTQ